MPTETHIARVTATFEFFGLVAREFKDSDVEELVKSKFKFFNPEIPGFLLRERDLKVVTSEVQMPDMS